MNDDSMIVGLTGQTGAGKSTVSQTFVQSGFALIDADRIARLVVEPGKPCLQELFDFFGDGIRNEDGTLHRAALAKIVFTNDKKRESLNAIINPYITEEILARIEHFRQNGCKLILLDAPTLFESKASDFCDLILSVIAPPELRLQRIMARDHISETAARERMSAQLDERFFIQHSDYIIRNQSDLEGLRAHAEEVAENIKTYYSTKFTS